MAKIAETNQIKVHACVGGTSIPDEKVSLQKEVHVIVGTPGRVEHMIKLRFLREFYLLSLYMYRTDLHYASMELISLQI